MRDLTVSYKLHVDSLFNIQCLFKITIQLFIYYIGMCICMFSFYIYYNSRLFLASFSICSLSAFLLMHVTKKNAILNCNSGFFHSFCLWVFSLYLYVWFFIYIYLCIFSLFIVTTNILVRLTILRIRSATFYEWQTKSTQKSLTIFWKLSFTWETGQFGI